MNIKGKIVWITGASSGIGAVMAYQFSAKGAVPILTARNTDKLEEIAAGLPGQHAVYPLDVTNTEQVGDVVKLIIERYGRIDILINNAGYGIFESFVGAPFEHFEDMMNVNYLGLVRCTQAVLPHMLQAGNGHIVNIASMAGKIGSAKSTGYSATKHAVLGFTNSLRQELNGSGISITAINPGPIATPFFDKADPSGNYVKNISWFMLKPEKVVRELIDAVERNVPEKNLPFIAGVGVKLFHLFPRIFDRIATKMLNKK
ncbi:SDR family NAD(P)-dependent oxidoreductase [Paenibacillus sp. SYP-B3998]|uniref:SDR family NAD(P)-dependent oxidoreductase n=1 Tax=Paenibacillus sp. SYP-B3998 TaxID=2678564 RepID=A0A6G4A2J6_9BACL|nr:SDR family NAD(P)-dependent oxidoreductase [Paenibacillus sp. SYP-B3998]NEW08550.1 SDR family NAD(P)-dependent oxidoreductase [Paenibacillus sp. SYP-B3998]